MDDEIKSYAQLYCKYPNSVFIETGTGDGTGISAALTAACFKDIHSIDIDLKVHAFACGRFAHLPNVTLHYGHSPEVLVELLDLIEEPTTFWLDAHGQGTCPILEELDAIRLHSIGTHTILIDDIKQMGDARDMIMYALRAINSEYIIKTDTGDPSYPDDVLVAYPPRVNYA